MQLPIIVLSYGSFEEHHKLFSYQKDGVHLMPIFTKLEAATSFCSKMSQILRERFKDSRPLIPQVCSEMKKAYDMFAVIMAYSEDLDTVIINPNPPDDSPNELRLVEEIRPIAEVVEELHELSSGAKTE